MKVGISSACLYPELTEIAVERMGKAGVQYSEIFINSSSELQPSFVEKLKTIKDRYGMEILSLHPYTSVQEPFMIFTDYKRRYDDALESYKLYFEAANQLGANLLVFHGDRKDSPFPDDFYFERFVGLQDLGASFGVTVAQENVARCKSRSVTFLQKMRKAIPDVRFVLDIKQAVRAGEDPFDVLAAMGDRVAHVHLSDHTMERDCLPIGKGSFDTRRLLQNLNAIGFDGGVLLELYRENYDTMDDLIVAQNHVRMLLRQP